MSKRSLNSLIKLSLFTSAALMTFTAPATLQERQDERQVRQDSSQQQRENQRRDRDDDDDDDDRGKRHDIVRVPSGQYVTPTVIDDSVQQYLNPGLTAYPD